MIRIRNGTERKYLKCLTVQKVGSVRITILMK